MEDGGYIGMYLDTFHDFNCMNEFVKRLMVCGGCGVKGEMGKCERRVLSSWICICSSILR
jgi:hypothetical protein